MSLRIKEVIKEGGFTIESLAEKMNISRVGLSQHINGNPSVKVLERIALALGCEVIDLFEQHKRESEIICPYCGKSLSISVKE